MSALTSGADDGAHGELVPTGPPPTLRWNLWATAVWCGLNVLSNVVLFGQRPYLRKALIDQNAKAKKPIADYARTTVNHDIHSQLIGGLVQALLVSVILLLLAMLTWRGRRWARWVLFVLAFAGLPLGIGVLAQLVFGVVRPSLPGIYRVNLVLAGLAALTIAYLLLHRTTREYFAALKETQRGNLPAVPGSRLAGSRGTLGSTGARPAGGGLGALFAPRRRPGPAPQVETTMNDTSPGADIIQPDITRSDTFQPDITQPDITQADNAQADNAQADNAAAAGPSGSTASRRPTATRPGTVKAKGSGNRPGRSKSRQQ